MASIKTNLRYVAFTSALGSALEYYSFIIYILLARYLGKLFFPEVSAPIALLNTLLIFAIGYLVAPLGAVGFSFIADRWGRKKTMVSTIILMAIATFAIGLLPTYQTAGLAATGLLIFLRLLQGIARGAETPGAITFMSEHAKEKHQGRFCGLLFFAIGTGALLASLVNYVLTSTLTEAEILHFGWRIPFLLAGILGTVGYQIRVHTTETPLFLAQEKSELVRIPIFSVCKTHFAKILIGMGLVWSGACLVNFGLFLPTFLQAHFGYSPKDTYLAMTAGFAMDFLLIIFGILADRITFKRFYLIGISINLILLYPAFQLLHLKTLPALYAFYFLYQLSILLLAACYPAMLARSFPTKVRYSGIAISYLTVYSFAGLIPLAINQLYVHSSSLLMVVGFFLLSSMISLAAGIFYRDNGLI